MAEILTDTDGAVRILTIDRPHKRNALAPSTADELREAIHSAESDPAIGAVVLTGTGGHFSAGGDADAILEVVTGGGDDAPGNSSAFITNCSKPSGRATCRLSPRFPEPLTVARSI